LEIKSSSALFKSPKNWRATRPLSTLIFFPKSPDQNLKIVILFSVVEKSNNYVFEDALIPHSPWGKESRLRTLSIVCILYRLLQSIQKISGGGYFTWWGGRSGGRGHVERSFNGGMFHGGREFFMKGVPDFPVLFKKRKEIKLKTSFSNRE
jgi:hypothetical protein